MSLHNAYKDIEAYFKLVEWMDNNIDTADTELVITMETLLAEASASIVEDNKRFMRILYGLEAKVEEAVGS